MARGKKLSDAEAKLKKKEYDRKRREKMKSNPEVLAKLREKERISYLKKKQKGQIKSVTAMSSRERRLKRKNWKKNSQSYRHRKAQVRKNLTSLLNKVSPSSSRLAADPVLQNNNKRESMIAVLRRKQLRKRRAIQYAKIAKLQKELKEQIRQKEKYKKRSQRRNKKVLSSPEAKVSALLKNVQVPKIVKQKLLFSEVITSQLSNKYNQLKQHREKKKYYEIIKPDLLKKHKLLNLSKSFFKHETYKKSGLKKVRARLIKIKQEVVDFLEKDENSRMCPGKKDYIKLKGQMKQKRLLTDTMKNLHKKFLTTVDYKVSLATFCRCRPFWVTWANMKDRNTCQCMIHTNVQLMITKLHENKALPSCNLTKFLATITCDVNSTKCLFRNCESCKLKMVEYYLPQPNRMVAFHQWMYETTSFEKDEKMKTVRKPGKKEIKVSIRELVQKLEETLPLFLQHVATIAHQYQTTSELKQNLSENEVLIHIDFSENYCSKYNEEIQSVHFGGARKQITLHTGVLYLRDNGVVKPQTFCSLSDNNRHDSMAVWAHLVPIFEWIKQQNPNIHKIHILSDGPVNQYKNKFIFHIVSHHINDLCPGTTFFSWNYSEPGHGKGAPDGVGGTLKRSADKAVAEGKDIVDLNSLKSILLSRCPSITLFEITTADITEIENLVKKSGTVTPFRGTQKIRQFVFASDILEFRSLSCCQCIGECSHFHLGYYLSSKTPHVETRLGKVQTRSCGRQSANNFFNDNDSQIDESYDIGDFVLIKWNDAIYPGKITSVSDDAAVVDGMERVIKSWRWPTPKDEALYPWTDVVQKIEPPKFIRKGYFSVKEINQLKL